MEYINVSQFYETVLCFALPLLLIQRMILYCTGLSAKYQQFRRNFYQAEFQITQEYKFIPEQNKDKDQDMKYNQNNPPKEGSIRDSMLENSQRENIRRNSLGQIINQQEDNDKSNQNDHNRMSRLSSRLPEPNRTVVQSVAQRKTYAELDLQTDKQFKVDPRLSQRQKRKSVPAEEKSEKGNKEQINSLDEEQQEKEVQEEQTDEKVQEKMEKEQKEESEEEPVGGGSQGSEQGEEEQQETKPQRKYSEVQKISVGSNKEEKSEQKSEKGSELSQIEISKEQELQEKTSNPDKMEEIQMEDRRQTELDRENLALENVNQSQKEPREQIEISPYEMEEREMVDRRRIKYCRRIDQAFSFYVPILFSVIVLGILTHSVYIFSMCCFFGFAFTSLLFNYGQLLQRLQDASTKESMFGKINKLLAGSFIIALFISYWIDNQFGTAE